MEVVGGSYPGTRTWMLSAYNSILSVPITMYPLCVLLFVCEALCLCGPLPRVHSSVTGKFRVLCGSGCVEGTAHGSPASALRTVLLSAAVLQECLLFSDAYSRGIMPDCASVKLIRNNSYHRRHHHHHHRRSHSLCYRWQ